MIRDFFKVVLINLRHRKLRTWLTVLGVVIGVCAIVALISVSSGLENSMNEQFEKMGTSRIFIYAKGILSNMAAEGVTKDDVEVVEKVGEVEWAMSYLYGSREGEYGRKKAFLQNLFGLDVKDRMQEKLESYDMEFIKGRAFKKGERKVMVLGYKAAKDIFDKEVNVGEKITVEGVDFKVIGVLGEIGSPDDDINIYIPMEDARELFDEQEKVTMIDVKIKDGIDINTAADKIKKALERARDDENFQIVTPDQLLKQVGDILGIMNIILGGIAAISIIVGGIGIMNSSYTSVLERTREIGIMKAIGAKNKDILMLFLMESGFIGAAGGGIGIILGTLISLGISAGMKNFGFGLVKIGLDWKLWLFSMIFAFGVGVVSGYFPAKKASSLKPATAMRY